MHVLLFTVSDVGFFSLDFMIVFMKYVDEKIDNQITFFIILFYQYESCQT